MKALRSSRLHGSFFHMLTEGTDTRLQILLQEKKSGISLDRVPDWVILLAFCILFSFEVLWTVHQKSATFDEPLNLTSGYVSLKCGDDRLIPQNLPLVKLLGAFPLLFVNNVTLPAAPRGEGWKEVDQYVYASLFLYRLNDGDRLLFLGRIAVLTLSLLLGVFLFFWTKQLFGRSAAAFALLLYSFEPNVLAHSGLITTDIATSCFMFLTIYGWHRSAQGITWRRGIFTGLALGLAMLTKFTTLVLCPILVFLGAVLALSHRPLHLRLKGIPYVALATRGEKLLAVSFLLLSQGLLAYAVIWAAYGFRYASSSSPVTSYPLPWESLLSDAHFLRALFDWARTAQVLPEAYLYGLTHMMDLSGKFTSFLMGEVRAGGWWYYFLVTFLIKTPIPFLMIVVWSVAVQRAFWAEDPVRSVFVAAPPLIYFISISASGWNIGHRHLLPVHPFLFVFVSSLIPWVSRHAKVAKSGIAALACWYVFCSAWISPHYLAYFNELAGGPDRGGRYLVDSNLDMGQDLKGLKRYMDEHGIRRVWLAYFGQASPDYYKISYDYLPSYSIFDPQNVDPGVLHFERLPPLRGMVAISATLLHGAYMPKKGYFEFYRQQKPVAKIGYSIFVYRFE